MFRRQSEYGRFTRMAPLLAVVLSAGAIGSCAAAKGTGPSNTNVVVLTGDEAAIPQDPPAPPIRLNQVGYLPGHTKWAVVASDAQQPMIWQLVDSQGRTILSGKTKPLGVDSDSGDSLHRIDFSSYRGSAVGLRLRVGTATSAPFDVRPDLYRQLKYDAVWYFYHTRSGIPIELPYAGQQKWVRPAGHLSDRNVPCAKDAGCDYSLDVSGGWYDAGDFGKYVVNGGIAVYTLMSLYERMADLGTSGLGAFADGKLRIPEQGNGTPDLLDEARWEVEFLLKMQVPEGQPLAGMAHHKMHDEKWTGLGYIPPTEISPDDPKRILRPPSTAATLNLAAAAAQSARVFRSFDPAFAARCLEAARRAWVAARLHPDRLAPASDTVGGGPYDDSRVSDEFYWAAVELFITTGEDEFRQFLLSSPWHNKIPDGTDIDGSGPPSAMTWQSVSGLGTISLAIVPNQLEPGQIDAARKELIRHADAYLKLIDRSGYGVPFAASKDGYPWGSNSFVINNGLVLSLAYDFSHEGKYYEGMVHALDYLLGENAMGRSYITGWGSNPFKNPHHRFWAHQELASLPEPPPGILSGGPNSGLQDPVVDEANLAGCKPMKCYIDHNRAYSVNEVTINWNAPLVWVATAVDESLR